MKMPKDHQLDYFTRQWWRNYLRAHFPTVDKRPRHGFRAHRGKRQRERAIRQNAMQRQLDSHKGEHVVKPRHIFGRAEA